MKSPEPIKITKQRRVILEELCKLHSHPTADELYAIVRKRLPSISLGTVYRNLEILSEFGMIHKLELAGAAKRFDGDVRCKRCGSVADVHLEPLISIEQTAQRVTDYDILSHGLEFSGICPNCKSKG